jgi:thiol:disulfide interchange protein DsbC
MVTDMFTTRSTILALLTAILLGVSADGLALADATPVPAALEDSLNRLLPDRKADSIQATPIEGLYEAIYGGDIFYITADGKYLLQGDLYALESHKNLTEAKRADARLKVVDAIDPSTMIIFKPAKTRYVVDVFTDLDCAYCRKLHSEIDSYLAEGIEIRYLAFPRSGYRTRSYYKAISAWCADDPKAALTKAKAGENIASKTCDSPVDQHMAAAHELGITGTPTLIMPDGSMVPGYVPAKQLARMLATR